MCHRVLAVDDDQATRRLIKLILELEGVEVLEATNGAECLEVLRRETVDLLLLDINMPGLSGWDVLRALKNSVTSTNPPTFIVSGEQPDRKLIREFQPEEYIRKPFDSFALALKVRQYLESGDVKLNSSSLSA